ncbi:MAG: hypothetical protein J07HQW2_00783 [Haloquadratum walsbyi J07HQW2]|uniref:Transposase n=1 Tax=Haloquadratum walsbyi J07HQW2 TaxID=1238425 RepID=U1MVB8_9EURY|nr:MAG: hypothetical protein J07HQW2_00783 [Haloquadratum walsbyi J07HQW2]
MRVTADNSSDSKNYVGNERVDLSAHQCIDRVTGSALGGYGTRKTFYQEATKICIRSLS